MNRLRAIKMCVDCWCVTKSTVGVCYKMDCWCVTYGLLVCVNGLLVCVTYGMLVCDINCQCVTHELLTCGIWTVEHLRGFVYPILSLDTASSSILTVISHACSVTD